MVLRFVLALPFHVVRTFAVAVQLLVQFVCSHLANRDFASQAAAVRWLCCYLGLPRAPSSWYVNVSDALRHRALLGTCPC